MVMRVSYADLISNQTEKRNEYFSPSSVYILSPNVFHIRLFSFSKRCYTLNRGAMRYFIRLKKYHNFDLFYFISFPFCSWHTKKKIEKENKNVQKNDKNLNVFLVAVAGVTAVPSQQKRLERREWCECIFISLRIFQSIGR